MRKVYTMQKNADLENATSRKSAKVLHMQNLSLIMDTRTAQNVTFSQRTE